jgi:hypothetical protein
MVNRFHSNSLRRAKTRAQCNTFTNVKNCLTVYPCSVSRGGHQTAIPHDRPWRPTTAGAQAAELWRRQSGGFNPVARPAELEQTTEIGDLDEHPMGVVEGLAATEESQKI